MTAVSQFQLIQSRGRGRTETESSMSSNGFVNLDGLLARVIAAVVLCLAATLAGAGVAHAGTGTVRPVPGVIAPWVTPTLADPTFSVSPDRIHGFDVTGFIEDAMVSSDNKACPHTGDPNRLGGRVTLNGVPIEVPCNMVIQLPASTMTWAEFVRGGPGPTLVQGEDHFSTFFPSMEIRVVGNVVGSVHRAGLMYASQQSVNGGFGQIAKIDYDTGNLLIDTGDSSQPAVVQINDPKGRFGRAQSPDERFAVDDANPTIHAGTGYPMCVPRWDPSGPKGDDSLCPQQNRPKVDSSKAHGGCRNFTDAAAGLPASGDLGAPRSGQAYCTQFVMPAAPAAGATTTDPDPRQQAPFEVGDWVNFSGTLMHDSAGKDFISAHTVEDNVGIYTQPATWPSYIALGEFGVGTADPDARAPDTLTDQEALDRIFLEAETTDIGTMVDAYYMDVDPTSGAVTHRWLTPMAMTGILGTGGIFTQNVGPQPQRIRLRAPRAPTGLLSQPTRTIQVVSRTLCRPVNRPDQGTLDKCLNSAATQKTVANGLVAGQYYAPVFDYIFPENIRPGDPLVPFDFWHLPFLRFGEGANQASSIGPGVGPLEPAPW